MSASTNDLEISSLNGPARPSISFESVTFSDGQTLTFDDDEIVVFVGPNNAGKSAALRELQDFVGRSAGQQVVRDAKLRKSGTTAELRDYLELNSQKTGTGADLRYSGIGFNIHNAHLGYFDQPTDRHPVAPLFSTRLATESRITASNPAGALALHRDAPSHPIHQLLLDPKLGRSVSDLFRRAFGKDLIVFRAGGSEFPLYVGERPVREGDEDELDKSFVDKLLAAAAPLQSQGDGMRSFATVLLYVLAAGSHSIQFLDEPEAFLHPPQAKLIGEYIARNRKSKSQLFVATHSTDVLDGLLAGGTSKVRIVRIQRVDTVNRIKELSKEKTAAIATDTLTRYSGVFRGIFYRHVIIVESDADCLFYNALLETKAVCGDQQPDVLFVHASGKDRMAQLADTLRGLDVPVSVLVDIDMLSNGGTFQKLFESLGGMWSDVIGHWQAIKTSVESLSPPINAEQVKNLVLDELKVVGGVAPFPKDSEKRIKNIFRTISPWDNVKHGGRASLRGGGTINHFDQLLHKCAAKGLWVVPVGELEGFCRSIEAKHGPAFAQRVVEERDLEADPELNEARKFMKSVWDAAESRRI